MAAVYRARDLRLNREVAVKILRQDLTHDPDFLSRFEREAQMVASLSHPGIVPVYDVGEDGGSRFIVMEYVPGRTLKDALESGGPLEPARAVAIMLTVLHALAYAHGRGLIHRDVKPQNILLSRAGDARLADFGIAHLAGGSTTRTAAILGSAHYLSPEQARGAEATVESDIYSCGIVLYEMLAGAPPFDGPNALAIANQHLHDEPEPLQQRSPSAPAALVAATMRALAKNPADRFPDAESFASALDAARPATDSTAVVPLSGHETEHTEMLTRDQAPLAPEPSLVLRRSVRKTVAFAASCALVVFVLAQAAGTPAVGHLLPAYPSLPYAAFPAGLAVLLLISWLRVRSWKYSMDGNAAVMQWGLFGHHRFGVPVRYITTLELKQSPIDRLLGVGTLELSARDHLGRERRLIMEDLPNPRETYEELTRSVGRALRPRPQPPG